ncbi:aminoacyl tRNA synthase complex-interacting multifunctional protein 2-like isoform X2 [Ornithodoros turicata]
MGPPIVCQLEERQDSLLSRLESLKGVLNKMKVDLGIKSSEPEHQARPKDTVQAKETVALEKDQSGGHIQDVVIGASPHHPPYSVWPLKHLLSRQCSVMLTCHTHSSVSRQLPEKIQKLTNQVAAATTAVTDRSCHRLVLTLMWKEMEKDCEVKINPLAHVPIVGEVNLIRYLGRLLTPPYDEGDPLVATETDVWLERVHQRLLHGTQKEQKALLQEVDDHLGSAGPYLLQGDSYSLADIAFWSALLQLGLEKKSPKNVAQWLSKLEEDPAFCLSAQQQ